MKRLFSLCFFPAFQPPQSGGELRLWHLMSRLTAAFDVRLLTPTYCEHQRKEVEHAPHLHELRLPKLRRYLRAHQILHRLARFQECSALVCSLCGPMHRELREEARRGAEQADVLLHHFPYLYGVARRARPGQLLAFDAHNVEGLLARQMFGSGPWGRGAAWHVSRLEKALAREADVITACSEEDADTLAGRYRLDRSKITVIPNGVDTTAIQPARTSEERGAARSAAGLSERPALLFFGSFHPPNIEAAEFLVHKLAPRLPECDLLIAGKCGQAFQNSQLPTNVRVLGLVDEATKLALLRGADGALNPMFSGSGTNLKMLDFLAAGLPIVSTRVGARGLNLEHRRHALIADEAGFSQAVTDLLSDSALRQTLAMQGRALAESAYSWNALGARYRDLLDRKSSRRILILNDFPVSPVDLGGKVRLQALGRQLAQTGRPVTMLTLSKDPPRGPIQHGNGLEERNIPRSRAHVLLDKILARALGGIGPDDVTALRFPWLSPAFGRALRREGHFAAAIVLSQCYMVRAARPLRRRGIPQFHDSQNVETLLKQEMYGKSLLGKLLVSTVRAGEREALQTSLASSCVTAQEREDYQRLFAISPERLFLCENGVYTDAIEPLPLLERTPLRARAGLGRELIALFLGSGHPPNIEAATFLVEEVAPATPDATFLLMGSVCGWFDARFLPENVVLLGRVSDGVKDYFLRTVDVALNPVFTGAGMNIKILDYLAAGIPVVTTEKGARGIPEDRRGALVVCAPQEFARVLAQLRDHPTERERLSREGRRLAVDCYDWRNTLAPFVAEIARSLKEKDHPAP